MGRSKVKLQWISNNAARRTTFNKRKKGLLTKVRELSTLCDVKACMIVYKPGEAQPEIWPTDSHDAKQVLSKFRKTLGIKKHSKNALNQEGFIRQQIEKMKEQLKKQDIENQDIEMNIFLSDCLAGRSLQNKLNIAELTCLALLMQTRMDQLRKRLEDLKERAMEKTMDIEVAMEEQQGQDWLPGSWMGFFHRMIFEST